MLHGALAVRIQRRQMARRATESMQLAEATPEDAQVWIEAARTQYALDKQGPASAAYKKACRLDESAMTIADWAKFTQLSIWSSDFDRAELCLGTAAALDPNADLSTLTKAFEKGLASFESFANPTGDYPNYEDEPMDEDFEIQQPSPPKELTPEEWAKTTARWNSTIGDIQAKAPALEETFSSLNEQAYNLARRIQEAEDLSDLAAIDDDLQNHLNEHATWRERQDAIEASYQALFEETVAWSNWAHEMVEWEFKHDYVVPSQEHYAKVSDLPRPNRTAHSETLRALAETAANAIQRRELLAQGTKDTLQKFSTIPHPEALARVRELITLGEPSLELLAMYGISLHRLGHAEAALVPLHQSLATTEPHSLAGLVRDALKELHGRGQALIPAAKARRLANDPIGSLALSSRAADLACLDAQSHLEESQALGTFGNRLHALRCVRLASNLAPGDRAIGVAHAQLALLDRELAEARQVVDRLISLDPRDTELLTLRAPILTMCGDREQADRDRRFAYELRGKKNYPQLGAAFNERLEWLGFRPYQIGSRTVTWQDKKPYDFAAKLFWFPGGDPDSDLAKQHVASIYAVMADQAEITTLIEEPEGLTAKQKVQWPAMSSYLRGEVQWAKGNKDKARSHFKKALKHHHLPIEAAYLIHKRSDLPMRLRGFNRHLPILVPQIHSKAEFAIKIAHQGQTVILSKGSHYANLDISRSVRIEGLGPDQSRLQYSLDSSKPTYKWKPRITKPGADAPQNGWIELTGLELQASNHTTGLAPQEALQFGHRLDAGALLAEACAFSKGARIHLSPGTQALFLDCEFRQEDAPFLNAEGASVSMDRCTVRSVLSLQGGSSLSASRTTLTGAGQFRLANSGTLASLEDSTFLRPAQPVFHVTDQATLAADRSFWASQSPTLATTESGGSIRLDGVETLGAGTSEVERVTASDVTTRPMVSAARQEDVLIVSDKTQLENALLDGHRHIGLKAGEYAFEGYEISGELRLVGQEPGVILHTPTNQSDHIFKVTKSGRLELEGIELDVKKTRKPVKGERLYGTTAGIMLDKSFDEYPLLRIHGTANLIDCTQGPQASQGDLIGQVESGGLLISSGLVSGRGLRTRKGGRAVLSDGGVRNLEVLDGGATTLCGKGELNSLKVSGPESIIRLHDLREQRIPFVSFRNGAEDPRSDLQRRRDGRDPEDLQREAITSSRRKWIDTLSSRMTMAEQARHLLEHAQAYKRAVSYTVNRRDERIELASAEVFPYLNKNRELQRAYLDRALRGISHGYSYFDEMIHRLNEEDRNFYYAENRAIAALGEDAEEADLQTYASWEEAILAKKFTRKEMEAGRELGLSPQGYRQKIARAVRQAKLREIEAQSAIGSGDKERIKRALQAISLDRWLKHVAESDATTSGDIMEALAAAPRSRWARTLHQRQAQFRAAAAPSQRYYGTNYSSGSSSYTAPNNDFQQWQVQRNTWNRNMDRKLDAIKSSSYRNFRNRYNY